MPDIEAARVEKAAIGRNSPCPCGSGLYYKHCCGQLTVPTPRQAEISNLEPDFTEARTHWREEQPNRAEEKLLFVLRHAPGHVRALRLLAEVKKAEGKPEAAIALLRRSLVIHPDDDPACCELSLLLYEHQELVEAEKYASNAVRLNPENPQAHNLLGMILTDGNRLHAGEYHYRKALELHPPVGKLCANLGLNLKNQGKLAEARDCYRKAMELEPDNVASLLGWAKLEEADRKLSTALELIERAREMAPRHRAVAMARSVLHRRARNFTEALASLDTLPIDTEQANADIGYFCERGEVLDKLQRYDEAYAAFSSANSAARNIPGRVYQQQEAENLVAHLKNFFTSRRVSSLPRASAPPRDVPTPIFIVGFPRSGTTMVEQILTSHPHISAGDELHFIWHLTRLAPQMLNSPLPYPECLADLWLGENQGGLDTFRDYYLRKSQLIGVTQPTASRFTDKMPLNETNLGLINLVFPESPIIHLIRHPLDVVLSSFFNDLTHGFNCSYGLDTAAHHYALVRDLVDHYLENMELNYLAVRYEDIVANPKANTHKLLAFIGEPWDERCLAFHDNRRYARTASYSQVTEKFYTHSVYRYRNYRKHLDGIVPILEPIIARLGYPLD